MKRTFDIWIVLPLIGLSLFSLFNVFGIKKDLFANQFFFFVVGFIALFILSRTGINFFKINAITFYIFSIILLVLTFIVGETVRGSKRWIDLYFFQFQASEFLKPFFLVFLADYLSKKKPNVKKYWFGAFVIFLVPFLIIFRQPDLGNSIIYVLLFGSLIFFAGFSIRYFIYIFALFFLALPVLWRFLKDYQKGRIISFINPELDSQGIAYNLIQSVITVGSGGLWGRGLGLGTQSRFRFLPEYHTDFAYASAVEQFGMVGGTVILLLFTLIIYRLIKRGFEEKNSLFNYFFLLGTASLLIISVGINVGMNLGLLPVTGIALPLISYGGSSIISTLMLLGLALSI